MVETRPIRVLQVLEATIGGTRKHLVSLLQCLDRSRFTAEVASPAVRQDKVSDTSFCDEVRALDVPLHIVPMVRGISPWKDLRGFWQLVRIIRQGRFDVVHLHSSKAGFLGRFAAKLLGCKTVYTPNGLYFLNAQSRMSRGFYLALEWIAGRLTDRLIAVSGSEREAALRGRVCPERKVRLIPNAVEAQGFAPSRETRDRMRAALGLTADAPVLGTVARFIPQKDPLTLVRAFAVVRENLPDVKLVWCGEGELHAAAVALARELGVLDAILFLGFRADVADVMNTFDVFVLSSVFEGLPYSLLEAMFVELPVVATDVVGNRDVIADGENGLLVPPCDPRALGVALLELLRQPQRRQALGRCGQQIVSTRYALPRMVADIEQVYRELAGF